MTSRSSSKLLGPRWLLSHLFVFAMVVTMVNLGFWQLRRLDERRDSNDQIEAAMARPPIDLTELGPADPWPRDHASVSVTGTYRPDHEVLVANRSFDGAPGAWLATPLAMPDGRVVAVVRGFVPRVVTAGVDDRPTGAPAGPVVVEGLAFESVDGGRVAEVDEGDIPQLSRMDLDRFEEVTGLEVVDGWIRLRSQDPPQPADLPIPVPDPELDEGPHLSYAFQWFSFSVGTVVVYWLILRRASPDRT